MEIAFRIDPDLKAQLNKLRSSFNEVDIMIFKYVYELKGIMDTDFDDLDYDLSKMKDVFVEINSILRKYESNESKQIGSE